jgi:hypothetical protein
MITLQRNKVLSSNYLKQNELDSVNGGGKYNAIYKRFINEKGLPVGIITVYSRRYDSFGCLELQSNFNNLTDSGLMHLGINGNRIISIETNENCAGDADEMSRCYSLGGSRWE